MSTSSPSIDYDGLKFLVAFLHADDPSFAREMAVVIQEIIAA